MAKRHLDQLDLDMIQCEKDGYGVHYGAWRAAKDAGLLGKPAEKRPSNPPDLTGQQKRLFCIRCGKPVPDNTQQRLYCGGECRALMNAERAHEKYLKRVAPQGPAVRACLVCGMEFSTTDRRRTACSPICAKVAGSERSRRSKEKKLAMEIAGNGV